MGNENPSFGKFINPGGQFGKRGSLPNHCRGNPSKSCDKSRDFTFGIHQAAKGIRNGFSFQIEKCDLGNTISMDAIPRGFYVDNGVQKMRVSSLKITKTNRVVVITAERTPALKS